MLAVPVQDELRDPAVCDLEDVGSFGDPIADVEAADALEFLTQQTADYRNDGKPDAGLLAMTDFCQTLLCLNEFVYVD